MHQLHLWSQQSPMLRSACKQVIAANQSSYIRWELTDAAQQLHDKREIPGMLNQHAQTELTQHILQMVEMFSSSS